jgi:hypothetical protein
MSAMRMLVCCASGDFQDMWENAGAKGNGEMGRICRGLNPSQYRGYSNLRERAVSLARVPCIPFVQDTKVKRLIRPHLEAVCDFRRCLRYETVCVHEDLFATLPPASDSASWSVARKC